MNQEIREQIRRDTIHDAWWNDEKSEINFAAKINGAWVLCARMRGGFWFTGVAKLDFLFNEHGKVSSWTPPQDRTTEFMRLASILLSEEKEVSQRED